MNRCLLISVTVAFLASCNGPSSEHDTPPAPVEGGSSTAVEAPVDELPQRLADVDPDAWQVAPGDKGMFTLAWRCTTSERIPRNESCELEVLVFRDDERAQPTRVYARAWMPDHGHGLVRDPLVTDEGEGRFRVEGLLLHMRGFWQLFFDVETGHDADVVAFELTL